TDIAARGIDVSHISHVINFDMPDTVDAYTHRIGRTGRAAKTGDAFTLTTQNDNAMVRAIENTLGMKLERRRLEDFDYTSPPARSTSAVPLQQSQRHHRQTGTGSKRAGSQMSSDSKPRYNRTSAKPFGKRRSSHAAYSSGSSARRPHSSHT
ncbi:MAG TPA: helicase-related protein, partial [Candidatus Wunengus sp. YC64]|uniref:helicase-related protein n=1 Tax=Candidatus Wunengus sp. YC64 TaxID=3367700 RepID=UPI004025EE4F